jgi:HlyD family secretion protein
MKVRFGLMDLQKYLGEKVAGELVGNPGGQAGPADGIASLCETTELGGQALQRLRELQSDIDLAEEKLKRAEDKLDWTQKLHSKEYVARTELEADKLEVKRLGIELEQARTSLQLFRRYEFPKEAEKLLSDYQEAQRELQRIEAKARSKEAQAQAKLDSSEAQYKLQKERLERLQKQLDACVIKAPKQGMVVYGSSGDFWARRNRPIEEGGSVRERQKIISIPDMSEMAVDVKIHEAWVDKIEPNLLARITVDAFPDKAFEGEVLKVAPLADPQAFWLDTGLKVYTTEVSVKGTDYSLKPGMSAKVEIVVQELSDVIGVPVQAVANRNGSKVCYTLESSGPEPCRVRTGVFNDSFIEIEEGLKEGQEVLLAPPRYAESRVGRNEKKESLSNDDAEVRRAGR